MVDLVLARVAEANSAEAHWSRALPLGLGYLAAVARGRGITVSVVDARCLGHRSLEETAAVIAALQPQVVGTSALTVEYPRAAALATLLKAGHHPPTTVLGGAHINALPIESLKTAPNVDYVIAGEAESSISVLLTQLRMGRTPGAIPGLCSRDANGAIQQHCPAAFDHDVATLPFPAWDLFPPARVYPILTERGCPYSCVFCSRNMSRRVRSRPVAHVAEEVQWLKTDFHAEHIYVEDETFGLKADRAYELLGRLAEVNRDGRICFKAQTRVDRVTPRLAQMMTKAGFRYVEIGVESGDQAVLDAAKKGVRLDQAESAVRMLREAGIKTWLNFIIGLPGETRESARKSIELAVRLNPDRLSVAIIVAYPGCDIYDWAVAGQNGYRLLTRDWAQFDKYLSPSVELEGLPYSVMRRLQLRMYLETYLRNLRLGEFARLIWKSSAFLRPAFRTSLRSHASHL